ncbi:MAG: RNA-binding protein [Eubacteriales bacterium]
MMDLQKGQLIKSKAGRDKDRLFVIIELTDEYVYLVDGSLRKIEKPKKKKIKHIQPVGVIIETLQDKINNDQRILNSEIRKAIHLYETVDK